MSVIKFSKQEFVNFMESTKALLDSSTLNLRYSGAFAKKFLNSIPMLEGVRNLPTLEAAEKFQPIFIDWMFHHLERANAFCYQAQYNDSDSGAEFEFPEKATKRYDAKQLLEELKSLDYNLCDNSGRLYVDPLYYEAFEYVLRCLGE